MRTLKALLDLGLMSFVLILTWTTTAGSGITWAAFLFAATIRIFFGFSTGELQKKAAKKMFFCGAIIASGLHFFFSAPLSVLFVAPALWLSDRLSTRLVNRMSLMKVEGKKDISASGAFRSLLEFLSSARLNQLAPWILFPIGAWLVLPYCTRGLVGTGDAYWYANMLGDFIVQIRRGLFPVFVGQSEYAFNGAIYPLRAAPYFQYLGAAIDFLSFRKLDFFSIQHGTLVLSLLGGLLTCYVCLIKLLPGERLLATICAALYAMCPGVLGLSYGFDLQMSVMTIPWLPVLAYGHLQSLRRDSHSAMIVVAVALSLLWSAHSPIGLWATILSFFVQIVRLAFRWREGRAWFQAVGAAILFSLLSVFLFVSLTTTQSGQSIVPYAPDVAYVTHIIREVFPAALLPLSKGGTEISDLQLGWALWCLFAIGTMVVIRYSVISSRVLIVSCGILFILLFPVPGLTNYLWYHFPAALVSITFSWPMQRFYVILAAFITAASFLAIGETFPRGTRSREKIILLLSCGLLWSLFETRPFINRGRATTLDPISSEKILSPENVYLTKSAYGFFAKKPAYYSHWHVDPKMESRLLDLNSNEVIADNFQLSADVPWQTARATSDEDIYYRLATDITLQPGQRYLLEFKFNDALNYAGTLRLEGTHLFREYTFPESGEKKAFGSKPDNAHAISLWTVLPQPEKIRLSFIRPAAAPVQNYSSFAQYRFGPSPPESRPVDAYDLLPYRAHVRAPRKAWLETPRMYLSGYIATVNGQSLPTRPSPFGLVTVEIPAGASEVEIRYIAPLKLRLAGAISCISWLGVVVAAAAFQIRSAKNAGHRPIDPINTA